MPAALPSSRARRARIPLCLGAILFAAAVLRVTRLDLMAFEVDEGVACIYAVRYTHHGLLPLAGVKTSLGFYNSPLFIYVLSPLFYLADEVFHTTDARVPALLFALLGTAAVYIVYRTGREFFSPAAGLLAASLMAIAPAAVAYSRRLWGHSLIQALCPFAFYFLLRWMVARRPKAVFWLVLVVVMAQQFHFSGALLWVPVLVGFLVFRPKTDWVAALCGLALGCLAYLPFLVEQLYSDFRDVRRIAQLIVEGTGAAWSLRDSLLELRYWGLAVTDLGHNNFLQQDYGAFLARLPLYDMTRGILGLAWVGALVAAGVWAVRELGGRAVWPALGEGRAARPLLALAWSLVPLAAFLVLRVPVVAPYFLVVYPVPFLAVACGAVALWRHAASWGVNPTVPRLARAGIVFILVAWGVHQVAYHGMLRWRLAREGGGVGSYVSYGAQRRAMRFIANHAPGRKVVISEQHRDPARGVNFRYWFLLWTFDRDMERFFPDDGEGAGYWRDQADYWYVIRNTNYRIRDDFDRFLERFPSRRFGPLRVFVIPRPGRWPRFGPR